MMDAPAARRHRVGAPTGWRWAAYELVLRRLPADDELCAALTCRAFRDALSAPRKAAERVDLDEPATTLRRVRTNHTVRRLTGVCEGPCTLIMTQGASTIFTRVLCSGGRVRRP